MRAYARPYPAATAGAPLSLVFDADKGDLLYRWSTTGPDGVDRWKLETWIVVPEPSYPEGYKVEVSGGIVTSKANARLLTVRANQPRSEITLKVNRNGSLPPLTKSPQKPASAGLSTDSLLGDLLADPDSRAILDKYLPGLTKSSNIGLATQISLRGMQPYLPQMSDKLLAEIDAELKSLHKN